MDKLNIAVLISGRGSNYQAIQRAIESGKLNANIRVVVSDKRKAAGLDIARAANTPIEVVPRQAKTLSLADYNSLLADTIDKYSPDLIVLAGFMRILAREFVSRFPNRVINIHPSLLPSFPGLHSHEQALEAGVRFSGCTIHFVTEEVDAGPILAQAVVPVLGDDTVDALADRVLAQEHKLYPAVIQAIANGHVAIKDGDVVWNKQDGANSSSVFLASLNPIDE
jgi:phosphoribosylglycinamide formyltransferase-1